MTQLVRERAGGRCEYCRDPESLSLAAFHIEHIIARQHGGSDDEQNLALACPDCNWRKGPNLTSVDPVTNEITRLFHPRTNRWEEHFAWKVKQPSDGRPNDYSRSTHSPVTSTVHSSCN